MRGTRTSCYKVCPRKVRYADAKAAKNARRSLVKKFGKEYTRTLRPYKCSQCERYHLGNV